MSAARTLRRRTRSASAAWRAARASVIPYVRSSRASSARIDRRQQHDDAERPRRLPGEADQLSRGTRQRAAVLGQLLDPRQQLVALEVLERRQRGRDPRDPHAEREARLVGQQRPLGAGHEREQPAQREQSRHQRRSQHDLAGVVRGGAVDHHAVADAVGDRRHGRDETHDQALGRRPPRGAEAGADEHARQAAPGRDHAASPVAAAGAVANRSAWTRNISA
jgi:hypothetical protein